MVGRKIKKKKTFNWVRYEEFPACRFRDIGVETVSTFFHLTAGLIGCSPLTRKKVITELSRNTSILSERREEKRTSKTTTAAAVAACTNKNFGWQKHSADNRTLSSTTFRVVNGRAWRVIRTTTATKTLCLLYPLPSAYRICYTTIRADCSLLPSSTIFPCILRCWTYRVQLKQYRGGRRDW